MISVVIASYGDPFWANLAKFALRTVYAQTIPVDYVQIHLENGTLAEARNRGALKAVGDRLVFLDADDTLDRQFCEKIVEPETILQPKTAVYGSHGELLEEPEFLAPYGDLLEGNHLIVGSPVNRQAFLDVGGFDEWPLFEDWALWLKMRKAGATFGKTDGVYNIHRRDFGRNIIPDITPIWGQIRGLYA